MHEQLPAEPHYDGIYLTREQLASPPIDGETAPQILAREFNPVKAGGQMCPVTWLEVARHAIVVRGHRPQVDLD